MGGNMIPLGALGAGGASGSGNSGMIPLGSLGGGIGRPPTPGSSLSSMPSMSPPAGLPPGAGPGPGPDGLGGSVPPSMRPPDLPPGMVPPGLAGTPLPEVPMSGQQTAEQAEAEKQDILAEIGKTAKDYLDVLMPIAIPSGGEDSRPVPKQVACLEDGTNLFKMFDCDMHRFDPKVVKKNYHRMAQYTDPEKLGREPSAADKARHVKLKQAYTVVMDEQLRGMYRQYCFGIAGSGGLPAQGHEAALKRSLELGRELRKMGEERAIVLHKASEVGWSVQQKDQDGRLVRTDTKKFASQFNLFGDISSSDDGDNEDAKERRNMAPEQVLEKSPKYADVFLEKVKPLLLDPKISKSAAGGAFTMHEEPKLSEMLNENPKNVQRILRKVRTSVKTMNWAMTALLQNKDSPWRGLETKASMIEHGVVKFLEIMKSGLAFGKFSEVHEQDFGKLVDNIHRMYMDLFERRGQELLRAAIASETMVVYLLPETEGRYPDGTRVILKELGARPDLNGKAGKVSGWDYSLQRYTVELEKEETKKPAGPSNPNILGLEDLDDDDDVDEEEAQGQMVLAVPKKLMILPKNAQVDLEPARGKLESLVKDWNAWRKRPRSVSASQDAEAVAAALGPPLESMAGYLVDACSAVATASGCPDGADLVADDCREALQGARNLAAKLLGEEAQEPAPPPPMNAPPAPLVAMAPLDPQQQALKEAAEVAQIGLGLTIKQADKKRSKSRGRRRRSRSRSRRRRRRDDSSSDDAPRSKKPKYG